ncbi:MAG: ABC transporter ATP-binding protein [Cyclobacteriaceae bacterium]
MNILQAISVGKSYGDFTALSDIDLVIPKQSIFGLLGPNGAGKTTLIRIINQIIFADTGQIIFDGQPLDGSHISRIGYLPEERGLYKKMKVGEQLLYLGQLKGMSRKVTMDKIRYWFGRFDMAGWWDKKVEDLSKGMQQKVQFITTVMHNPELIILDEPFSGFDPINANLIRDEILELRNNGATIIFSTHRMETVEELCDYIALIHKSKKILDGPKSEIKKSNRTNTFMIDHLGKLTNDPQFFDILEEKPTYDEYTHTVIKTHHEMNPNELLKMLMSQIEIHGFQEKVPSMNEIFIANVNAEEHA